MSFSNTPSSARTQQPGLEAALQANTRLCLIGVSKYDDPTFAPVSSATNNVFSWLIVAMRMGAEAPGNQLLVEEASDTAQLITQIGRTFDEVDLDNEERASLRHLLENMTPEAVAETWVLRRPTLAETTKSLAFLGAFLDANPGDRLLVSFSGHGAQENGRPVLCLADTRRVADPTQERQDRRQRSQRRKEKLIRVLKERHQKEEGARAAPLAETLKLFKDMASHAEENGLLGALLDVLLVALDDINLWLYPDNTLLLFQWVNTNLQRMSAPPRSTCELKDALTVEHLRLALGDTAERVTLVLDACHSGGSLDALQGNTAGHPWIQAGLNCRIISASATGGVAAEARIGERRQSAATWALTQVLSRWGRVLDGPTYALGIRNGDLVQRANLLLSALSFRQQLTLHAPALSHGISAADLPFCGLDPATRTWSDPNAQADAIQVTGESTGLTEWKIYQGTTLRAVLLAVGGATDWQHTPADPAKPAYTYQKNQLYVLTRKADANALAGGSFEVKKYTWNGTGSPSQDIVSGVEVFNNTPWTQMPASNDPDEHSFGSATTLQNVSSQQIGNNKRVFLQWTASSGSTPPRLQILTKATFPFTPSDFAADGQAMSFPAGASETFPAGSWYRQIDLPNS